MQIKKCFTINPNRKTEEINSYKILFEENIYQAIEIFYPYNLDEKDFITYTNNIKSLINFNIEVVMHLPYGPKNDLCDLTSQYEVMERIKDAIKYGKEFRIKKYTLHLGYAKSDRNSNINNIIKVLKELCDYASNSIIMIENMPGKKEIGYSPNELKDIIKRVNKDNLKITFDIGHANVSDYTIDEYLSLLNDYITHIHISNNNGISDQHQKISKGNINFTKFVKRLTTYQGLYCLEILYHDVNDLISNSIEFDKVL